ncbi:OmpW/AlkL family protein [Actimicrobium sp. GrIS 1.19]|uniref:OmpW/AlkL family protein n=1 Tax=Actimicrobium sp. GrIS 1.19 TaxID=3071708 RepID=UPI002E0D8507
MKKTAVVLAILASAMFSNAAMAQQQSPWMVRVRALNLDPDKKSDPVGGVGARDRVTVDSKTFPELDISYFFTPNIAAELILTYPQKHDVRLDGNKIGTLKHLPPTLLAQYHFMPAKSFDPYLGVGINYTSITNVHLLNDTAGLDHSSVGYALQAGIDFNIDKNWSINLDVKKLRLRTDLTLGGVKVSNLQVDPLLVAVGVGYRF